MSGITKPAIILTINSEYALSYEELVIAAMKVDWYRRPDDTINSTKRKFIESLTQELRNNGENFFEYAPFSKLSNNIIEYSVEPAQWFNSLNEYEELATAISFINEIF